MIFKVSFLDFKIPLKLHLFTFKKLSSIPFISKLISKHVKNLKNFRREIIISQIVRELINTMVVDVINTTKKNLKSCKPRTINDIYNQDRLIVDFSNNMKIIDKHIKYFLKLNMYNNIKVIVNTNKGKKIINDLFIYLLKNPRKYINNALFKNETKERVISDFIAGMTDIFALEIHRSIFTPKKWSFVDFKV